MGTKESNEARVDRALKDLRSEPVPTEGRVKLADAMRNSHGPSRARLVLAGGATAAMTAAGLLLWLPQKALAWDQIVSATLSDTKTHETNFRRSADGTGWVKSGELWFDGIKSAQEFWFPRHMMFRYDGKRFFSILPVRDGKTEVGVVSDFKSTRHPVEVTDRYSLGQVLKRSGLVIAGSPAQVKLDGRDVLKYVGFSKGKNSEQIDFYADPATKTIVRWENLDDSGKVQFYSDIQRVDSIPDWQFEPPRTGVRVVDENAGAANAQRVMARGIPFGRGNVLRAVYRGPNNQVTIEWTGTPPNADATPHARIEGYKSNQVFSSMHFGMDDKDQPKSVLRFNGQVVYVLTYILERPVQKTVTLDMPVLVLDMSHPIKNAKGDVVAHWSKQVGTKRLENVHFVAPSLWVPPKS
jgi:hypothetical protein